ncbi:MAG: GAP family protein [Methanomicrobiales archaeon]|nr:GAP family protein [Methanomicrobiales archaeon]
MNLSRSLALLCIALALLVPFASAQGEAGETLVGYYFTSDGCGFCAKVNPHLLGDWRETYPALVVVEYELATRPGNSAVLEEMDRNYRTGFGVPILFIGPSHIYTGDSGILSGAPPLLEALQKDPAARPAGSMSLASLDLASLKGMPRVWHRDRILVRTGPGGNSTVLRSLLADPDPAQVLKGTPWTRTTPDVVTHPGVEAAFQHAVQLNGWIFQWNGTGVVGNGTAGTVTPVPTATTPGECETPPPLEVGKVVALAAVNAINPCGLAVLVVVLLSLITRAPDQRRQVLLAGLAFTAAVFLFYFLYGIAMVTLFQMVPQLASLRIWFTRVLGVVAIVIGLLYLRDAFSRTSAAPSTAIPAGWKGSLKGLLDRISSPAGAFVVGAVVTLFLLPCTIGPYLISCGILSAYDMAAALPYLILYNVIFVLPMLAVTLAVYLGISRLSEVKEWRERSVQRLRLVAGLVILLLGVVIALGIL